MTIEVDRRILEHMEEHSGALQLEVRSTDTERAVLGMEQARRDIFDIPHPEQPDEPYPSFASPVEVGPRGPGFWVDMADAEAYEGVLEGVVVKVVAALEAAGVTSGA